MSNKPTMLIHLNECPFCGGKVLRTKDWAEGPATTRMDYNLNTEAVDNTEMYSSLQHTVGDRAYCDSCGKFIGTVSDNKLSVGAKKQIDKMTWDQEESYEDSI